MATFTVEVKDTVESYKLSDKGGAEMLAEMESCWIDRNGRIYPVEPCGHTSWAYASLLIDGKKPEDDYAKIEDIGWIHVSFLSFCFRPANDRLRATSPQKKVVEHVLSVRRKDEVWVDERLL